MQLGRNVKPEQRHPPALIWWCPDPECDWTHHARDGRDGRWERGLAEAWDRHRYIVHSNMALELQIQQLELEGL